MPILSLSPPPCNPKLSRWEPETPGSGHPPPLNLQTLDLQAMAQKRREPLKQTSITEPLSLLWGKRRCPAQENKKVFGGSKRPNPVTKVPESDFMKRCGQILTKLMKHKHGWVFNVPVDVVGMALHDYYTLVKNPMDLGNAKTRLNQSFYSTPLEFAADVRVTFHNALTYNPKGYDVGYEEERRRAVEEAHQNSFSGKFPVQKPAASPEIEMPPVQLGKQPKSKARDPNKREMSFEEK
ncbi:hypothetical protein AMTRI_Chr01g132200 [Amborella trichopoda]